MGDRRGESGINKHGLVSFLSGQTIEIPDKDLFGSCRFVGDFEKLNRVGEGTYGVVCEFMGLGGNTLNEFPSAVVNLNG